MTNRPSVHELVRHSWHVPMKRAAALQTQLAAYVNLRPMVTQPAIVAGVDSAQAGDHIYVAVVVMDMPAGKVIEIQHAEGMARFPYVVGYRAFRDGPIMLKAIARLINPPGLYIISGQGVCHPRLFGIASHIGLRLDKPTIGCGRDRLVGHYEPPGPNTGDYSVIRYSPQAPGVVLRTKENTNPVFVSPGHRIDLLGAIEQTLRCCSGYRIPEPLRRAHIEAGRFMRRKQIQDTSA